MRLTLVRLDFCPRIAPGSCEQRDGEEHCQPLELGLAERPWRQPQTYAAIGRDSEPPKGGADTEAVVTAARARGRHSNHSSTTRKQVVSYNSKFTRCILLVLGFKVCRLGAATSRRYVGKYFFSSAETRSMQKFQRSSESCRKTYTCCAMLCKYVALRLWSHSAAPCQGGICPTKRGAQAKTGGSCQGSSRNAMFAGAWKLGDMRSVAVGGGYSTRVKVTSLHDYSSNHGKIRMRIIEQNKREDHMFN